MSDDIKQDLEKILKKLDKLEDIINRPHDPYIYQGDTSLQPYCPSKSITCSKCSMTFEDTSGYYCSENDCPTFTKVI